jgi:hypothetical protein
MKYTNCKAALAISAAYLVYGLLFYRRAGEFVLLVVVVAGLFGVAILVDIYESKVH